MNHASDAILVFNDVRIQVKQVLLLFNYSHFLLNMLHTPL